MVVIALFEAESFEELAALNGLIEDTRRNRLVGVLFANTFEQRCGDASTPCRWIHVEPPDRRFRSDFDGDEPADGFRVVDRLFDDEHCRIRIVEQVSQRCVVELLFEYHLDLVGTERVRRLQRVARDCSNLFSVVRLCRANCHVVWCF